MNNEKLLYTEEYFSQQGLAGIKRDFFYAVAVQILKGNFWRLADFDNRFSKKIRDLVLSKHRNREKLTEEEQTEIDNAIKYLRPIQECIKVTRSNLERYVEYPLEDLYKVSMDIMEIERNGFGNARDLLNQFFQGRNESFLPDHTARIIRDLLGMETRLKKIINDDIQPEGIRRSIEAFNNEPLSILFDLDMKPSVEKTIIKRLLEDKEIVITSLPVSYLKDSLAVDQRDLIRYDFSSREATINTLNREVGRTLDLEQDYKKKRPFNIIEMELQGQEGIVESFMDRTVIIYFLKENQQIISIGESVKAQDFWGFIKHLELEVESEDGGFIQCRVVREVNPTVLKMLTFQNYNKGAVTISTHATIL